jgi:hypothetical protein
MPSLHKIAWRQLMFANHLLLLFYFSIDIGSCPAYQGTIKADMLQLGGNSKIT